MLHGVYTSHIVSVACVDNLYVAANYLRNYNEHLNILDCVEKKSFNILYCLAETAAQAPTDANLLLLQDTF